MAQHQWHFRSTQRDNRPDEWKLWRASMSTSTSTMCWCNLRVIAACKYSETNNLLTVERRDCVMPVVGILRHFSLHQVHHATVQYPAAAIHARFKERWLLILIINLQFTRYSFRWLYLESEWSDRWLGIWDATKCIKLFSQTGRHCSAGNRS